MMDLSTVKLEFNHKVAFNLADDKVESILCFGDTVNFFGFVNAGSLDIMHMNDNDRTHYLWLLKQVKQGAVVYVVGQEEEKEYYAQLFDVMGSLGVKVMWKYMYVDHPNNYVKIIQENFSNTIFDCIFAGLTQNDEKFSFGNNILGTIDNLYDIYKKKMYILAPNDLWEYNLPNSHKTTLDRISSKLNKITNYLKSKANYTKFMSLYEFNEFETKHIVATSILGDIYVLNSLSDDVTFTEYEKKFIKYFENKKHLKYFNIGFNENIPCKIKQSSHYLRIKEVSRSNSFINLNLKTVYTEDEMLNFISSKHKKFNHGTGLCISSYEAAKNLETALSNPLFKFILYRTKNIVHIAKKTLAYVIDIDWEDPRTVDDKWLLIMLGCPKEEAQEYAEYCRTFVNKNIK